MLHNAAPTTVSWISNTDGKTLVNVGTDAVGVNCQNIIAFYDIKTNARSFYKADTPSTGCGITHLAGHNRFPLFAFSEALLRPSIHVVKYPEMEKLVTMTSEDITNYVDLRFSDFNFLIALGGYPNYILRVWNYRTGALYADIETNCKSSNYSLLCSNNAMPHLMQYSQWTRQLLVWELCHTAEKHYIYEIASIHISEEFSEHVNFSVAYGEDGHGYMVNDFGTLYLIEIVRSHLKRLWSPNDNSLETLNSGEIKRQSYGIFANKLGLLLTNSKHVYFVKQRASEWVLEWHLDTLPCPFVKMISTFHNEIIAINDNGSIFKLEPVQDSAQVIGLCTTNCLVRDYVFLKGIKEEVALLFTTTGELQVLDLIRLNIVSTLLVQDAITIATHNILPYVAVSDENGLMHFISYEKVRTPTMLASVKIDTPIVTQIRMLDKCAFLKDANQGFHIMSLNWKQSKFVVMRSLQPEIEDVGRVVQYFMLNEHRAIVFGCFRIPLPPMDLTLANKMWTYEWEMASASVHRTEFLLPHKYRDFVIVPPSTRDNTEFYCVRFSDFIVDAFVLSQEQKELNLQFSIQVTHFGHINGISGNKNLLTWGVQSIILHFRNHRKSKGQYVIRRAVLTTFVPRVKKRVDECFNSKYLLMLFSEGTLLVYRLPIMTDNLRENAISHDDAKKLSSSFEGPQKLTVKVTEREVTEHDLERREHILKELETLSSDMRDLIAHDIEVTGKMHGIYRKFCLNHVWLDLLIEQARILCEKERISLLEGIADQCRIRDWILDLIGSKNTKFCFKIRSIFSNIYVENYSVRTAQAQKLLEYFDRFRFYEMEASDEDEDSIEERKEIEDDQLGEEEGQVVEVKNRRRYVIKKGDDVYEHVMAKEFEVQDIHLVFGHQLYNEDAKFRVILMDALMVEFNKKFTEIRGYKQDIMDNVISTNATLNRIYSNMNCMLCLLGMEQFEPPEQSVPQWFMDEMIERILTVDDAEIKAINRHKQKAIVEAKKSGRMLLWAYEFWSRALMVMMDGVLEKLWEEEIKKTPLPPEFMLKKTPHEYNLEEQKMVRAYEETLNILEQDRRKYLKILNENEGKTLNLKRRHIMRLNERVAELSTLKLKYDYAVRHGRLRLFNFKLTNLKRIQMKRKIQTFRERIEKINVYIERYTRLVEFWESTLSDLKVKQDQGISRDRLMDKQFKAQYLPIVPAHLSHELNKIFKRRPKFPPKVFNSAIVCYDVADRIVSRKTYRFPLPFELMEHVKLLDTLDDMQNCPNQLDLKLWEQFVKVRRQKLESELRLKGVQKQLADAQSTMTIFEKDLEILKNTRTEVNMNFLSTLGDFFHIVQDQYLQITLTLGQVEIYLRGNMLNLNNCILMRFDDVNNVNEMIKQAGKLKLKAMQRVAFFRRKVIFKEWEHRVVRANIEYLKYILHLVEKCKVTYEFLDVLRNWNKLKENREAASRFGLIENSIEQKIKAARKNLEIFLHKIDEIKSQIEEIKRQNQFTNKAIEDVKVSVTYLNLNRDTMNEEKLVRERRERMSKIKKHRFLLDEVKRDYVHIMELTTILELQRLRTYPTLGPAPPQCYYLE